MSSEENKDLIRRFYDEIWHDGNFDVFGQFVDDDEPWLSTDPAHGTYKQVIMRFREMYPGHRWSIDHMVADDDHVAWHWTFLGVNADTGMQETQHGVTMCRIVNGKIVDRVLAGSERREV